MILRRYINQEVLKTSLVVMLFLLMMTMGNWLIRYFGMAAKGKLAFGIVMELMFYQLPELLELILPLSFFIGLMLTFGRQYVEHEMTIIKTAGMSPRKFAQLLSPLITCLFILQLVISLYARPLGLYAMERLKAEQAIKSTFDLVKPQEFVSFNQYSLFVGSFSEDKRSLQDIVLVERGGAKHGRDRIILANRAEQVAKPAPITNANNGQLNRPKEIVTQLDLYDGKQYELSAANQKYNQIGFERYRVTVKLPNKNSDKEMRLEAKSTLSLLKALPDKTAIAELGYRITLPFVIFLAIILALPLSYVRPRQGRWVRLLPAILLFATSVLIMNSFKGSISKGKLPVIVYPAVLSLYALFGIYLYNKSSIHHRIKNKLFVQRTHTPKQGDSQ